jgi:mevalonate kinase
MMRISCPSKTFLTGEYAVIGGGPAILIATPPYFVLENNLFKDPYLGAGGFGASGARFVLASKKAGSQDAWQVWEKYQQSGRHGSGADVAAQWMGGVTFFHAKEKIIESLGWSFPDLLIGLIHTGYKIQTHVHLQDLKDHNFQGLERMVLETYRSLKSADQKKFVASIQAYADALQQLNLVCDNTQKILAKIKNFPEILAAKGCGALGADVILVVIKSCNRQKLFEWIEREKLNMVFCDNQFANGVL